MAGPYPDPPSYRMAWHEDGTQIINMANMTVLSQANLQTLNREAGNVNVIGDQICIVFPEFRDLDALWLNGSNTQTVTTYVSTNTTNGIDGTWTTGPTVTITPDAGNPLGAGWRTSIASYTALSISAIKFQAANLRNIHIYGELSPDETTKRIELWHPSVDMKQPPNWFDWGNTPRGSSGQTSFRLKNMSPSQTANDVLVTMQALTDTTPSVPAQHLLSLDGLHWGATVDAGDIAPTAMSPVIHLRRVTPSNAVLTTPRWAFTIKPDPTSWS